MEAQTGVVTRRRGVKFGKITERGWDTISGMAENPAAVRVYAFLGKHCDHLNALGVSVNVLALELGYNERTIRKATHWLQEKGYIAIAKQGTANVYILDPRDIWKNFDHYKHMCSFSAKVLIGKAENKMLKTRLTHMMRKRDAQGDLLDDVA